MSLQAVVTHANPQDISRRHSFRRLMPEVTRGLRCDKQRSLENQDLLWIRCYCPMHFTGEQYRDGYLHILINPYLHNYSM